jgi:uncharacterized repeat protein (TIGR02543 family)
VLRSMHRSVKLSTLLAFAVAAACSFPPPPDVPGDGEGSPIDGSVIDMMPDTPATAAVLESDDAEHDFFDVSQGQSSAPYVVLVRNAGDGPSSAIDVTVEGANVGDFEVVSLGTTDDCDGAVLEPETTCRVQVRFRPTTSGARTATLRIAAESGGALTFGLSGNGLTAGDLEITAGSALAFGNVEIASQSALETVTVRNTGETATAALTVVLGDEANYSKVTDGCGGASLAAGATCDVAIRFDPEQVGAHPAQVSIRESATVGVSSAISGTGTGRLAVTRTGAGAITSSPSGIDCGTGCPSATATFAQTPITLTAMPDAGYVFDGWTGACAGSVSNVCSVALVQPLTQTAATFQQVFTLNVAVTGSGTVTGTGISCGSDCNETFDAGTMLTLTAEPDPGYEVYAWSGTGTSCGAGLRMCAVTMSQARNVTVEFRRQYTVTVNRTGSGTGTVSGGAINCGSACAALVFTGSSVTLNETPASATSGSRNVFTAWSGPCSNASSSCSFTVTADTNVGAQFTLQHQLAVTIGGTGTGSVSSTPSAISCPGTCSAFFDAGSTVTLAQSPVSSNFDGYGGDCTGASCAPAMNAPRNVTATFTAWQCTPNTVVCDDVSDQYTDCSSTGTVEVAMQCLLGCATGVEKCVDLEPSVDEPSETDLGPYLDMAKSEPGVVFTGVSTINTSTGAVSNGGVSTTLASATVDGKRVFWLQSLEIQGTLKVTGSQALVLLVDGTTMISGLLDVSADGATNGPGIRSTAHSGCDGTTIQITPQMPGAGGGSRATVGGKGGNSSSGTGGSAGGLFNFDNELVPLEGGCRGGVSKNGDFAANCFANGGGGGGAVQIVSRGTLTVSGQINAGGGGGRGDTQVDTGSGTQCAGGGGGSGGAVLLESPSVVFTGASAVIAAKGGGGAAMGTGTATQVGADADTASTAAAGGTNSGLPSGGAGATESAAAVAGGTATGTQHGGGGGGGLGRVFVRTQSGSFTPQGGAVVRAQLIPPSTIRTRNVP